jgi:hypothetical protein
MGGRYPWRVVRTVTGYPESLILCKCGVGDLWDSCEDVHYDVIFV